MFIKRINALSLTTRVLRVFLVCVAVGASFPLAAQTTGQTTGGSNNPAQQENISISGTVLDEDGLPLPGVAIRIKGTDRGVSTNVNGEYTLIVPDQNAVLVYSFMGFITQELVVGNRRIRTVILKPDVREIEDVVVVGYTTQRREDVVGAVTSIKPAELKCPTSNLTTLLGGKIAGMISFQRSGEPGMDNAEFFIRGLGSFGAGKVDPLILIDGIESSNNDLARLQVDDIKDFSVLKDATASAVYGARGANGVVLVNTKSGEQGATKLSFRVENSLSTNTRNFQLADNITYMELANEARLTRNPDAALIYPNSKIAQTKAGANPLLYPDNHWVDELIKPITANQRYNASLSGGGRVARFYLAGTYSVDNGVLKDDSRNNFKNNVKFKSYSIRSNTDINFTKTTWGSVRVYAQFRDYTGPIGKGSATFESAMSANPVAFPMLYPQRYSPSAEHPLFGSELVGGTNTLYVNPYASMVSGYQQELQSTINAQMEFKQDFSFLMEGLRARAMGYVQRYSESNSQRSYSPFYYYATETPTDIVLNQWNHGSDGTVGTAGTDYLTYKLNDAKAVNGVFYGEAAVDYDRAFGAHSVTGMLVGIIRHSVTGLATNLQASLPSRNVGLSGRFTYGYASKYLLEMNFGYNGSERFSSRNRWGFFPSIGGGWIISNEDFFAPAKGLVSMFKLRASYGMIGNDQIGDSADRFFYISTVDLNNSDRGYTFGEQFSYTRPGVRTTRYENLEIGWEESRQLNLGLDLTVAGVNMVFEVYQQDRSHILLERSNIPKTMGLHTVVKANTGEARSRGVDLSVEYNKNFANHWRTALRGSFTFAQNKFTVYDEPQYNANEYYRSKVGYPFKQVWGYVADRLFVDEYEVANSPAQGRGAYPISGGDIKYRDVNRDGSITAADQVPIGYPTTPEMNFGFGGTVGYKNFDFSCYFTGIARTSLFIDPVKVEPFVLSGGLQHGLLEKIAGDHWSEDNRNLYAFWPRLSETPNTANTRVSTWWMHNGALLRLKTLEMGYNLPQKSISTLGLSNLRVYFSGVNLFTISQFKIWDPEMGGNGLGYPNQLVFNLGLSLTL